MWIRALATTAVLGLTLFLCAPSIRADTLTFKDGSTKDGVIKRVAAGKVVVEIGDQEEVFDILNVKSMDFNTPHLLGAAPNVPVEHFMKDVEAQELVRNFEQLEKTESELRMKLDQIRGYWERKQPIDSAQLAGWEAAKEEFRKPLERYQEILNDTYFHVLAKVDRYNDLARQAHDVYVGVKGIRTGSALIEKDMEKLPLRKYVPASWYDTIYYDGYNRGWDEAYEKFAPPKLN